MTPEAPSQTQRPASKQHPAGDRDRRPIARPTPRGTFAERESPSRPDHTAQGMDGKSAGWLLLLPLVCCGSPVLIAAASSAGAIGWGALGAGAAAAIAAVALALARGRASADRCCDSRPADGVRDQIEPELSSRRAARR